MDNDNLLPNLGIDKLCMESPLLILDNRIYFIDYKNTSDRAIQADIITGSQPNPIKIKLIESETLRNYEINYLKGNEHRIKRVIASINKGNLEKRTITAEVDLFTLKARYPILEFIYSDVFPYYLKKRKPIKLANVKGLEDLIKTASRLKSLVGGFYKQIQLKQRVELKDLSQSKDPYQSLLEDATVLEELIKDPMLILESLCYRLLTYDSYRDHPFRSTIRSITINNQRYYSRSFGNIGQIEEEFIQLLYERIKRLTLSDTSLRKIERLLKEKSDFAKIVTKTCHMENGIGFLIDGSKFYVTRSIPEFALQDADGNFYAFKPCNVAVGLVVQGNDVVDWGKPIILENYSHPFLLKFNQPKQGICLSSSEQFEDIKSDIIKTCRETDKGNVLIEHQIYIALEMAVSTIQSGYFGGGNIRPYHGLSIESYGEEHRRFLSNPTYYRKKLTNNMKIQQNARS